MARSSVRVTAGLRQGIAAVELAILLPFLCFVFLAAVDFGRVFYYSIAVTSGARSAAMHGADSFNSPFESMEEAMLAEVSGFVPEPTLSWEEGMDGDQKYLETTVSYPFRTIAKFPGLPDTLNILRRIRVVVPSATPRF